MKALYLASALGLAALAAPAIAQDGDLTLSETAVNPNETVLSLSITESVSKAPDQVILTAGVETNADSASAALAQNTAKMTSVIAALKAAGIPEKNIQTSGINVSPRYRYDQENQTQVLIGYTASNMVTVKSDKVGDAGKLIDALVGAGATNISGPTFTLRDPDPVRDQARGKAMKTAEGRARLYMQAGGFTGMRIISISEQSENPPMPYGGVRLQAADASNKTTPVEPGEVDTGVTIRVKYALSK